MEKYKWIAQKGKCSNEDLLECLSKVDIKESKYIAMYVDSFCAGFDGEITSINSKRLLEIRVFNEEAEFLATRGSIGEDFSWRITSDKNLNKNDYLETEQYLDINKDLSKPFASGCMEIISTGGGKYILPIDENLDRVKVRSYIHYDSNGMAKVVDSRICCFL